MLRSLKTCLKESIFCLKYPRPELKPTDNVFWHAHICIPFRLGKNMFNFYCPYHLEKDFKPEMSDLCENCKYFSLLYNIDNNLKLKNNENVLDKRE